MLITTVRERRPGACGSKNLPVECVCNRNDDDQSLAVPDLIVNRRGRAGPNLLVLELNKTTNPDNGHCDQSQILRLLVANYQSSHNASELRDQMAHLVSGKWHRPGHKLLNPSQLVSWCGSAQDGRYDSRTP
jgi:hypothetical protein